MGLPAPRSPSPPARAGLLRTAAAAAAYVLAPIVAFLAGVLVGDAFSDHTRFAPDGWYSGVFLYLVLFFGPACFPLALADSRRGRLVVSAILSAAAAWAGVAVMVTDDGQAGLAVLWVPIVAVLLGLALLAVALVRSFTDRRR